MSHKMFVFENVNTRATLIELRGFLDDNVEGVAEMASRIEPGSILRFMGSEGFDLLIEFVDPMTAQCCVVESGTITMSDRHIDALDALDKAEAEAKAKGVELEAPPEWFDMVEEMNSVKFSEVSAALDRALVYRRIGYDNPMDLKRFGITGNWSATGIVAWLGLGGDHIWREIVETYVKPALEKGFEITPGREPGFVVTVSHSDPGADTLFLPHPCFVDPGLPYVVSRHERINDLDTYTSRLMANRAVRSVYERLIRTSQDRRILWLKGMEALIAEHT